MNQKKQRKLFDKYFDEGFVLMLVLPIQYAQPKSSDINSVSVVCCHDDVRIRNDY
jgi:hypothetical protein